MIIEIPNASDFATSSLHQLHLAWGIVVSSIESYQVSDLVRRADHPSYAVTDEHGVLHTIGGPDPRTDEEIAQAEAIFWRRSQPALGNAVSLIQQAVEMALKGRIAAISPFLLILREGRELPKSLQGGDIPFSAFRTVDASDLLRLHNAVVEPSMRMNDKFATFWEDLRRRRNIIMHSARPSVFDGRLLTSPELAEDIIRITLQLHPGKSWYERLVEYGEADADSAAYTLQPNMNRAFALKNLTDVTYFLRPAFLREFLGIETRRRLYECPSCLALVDREIFESDGFPAFAKLVSPPNETSKVVCPICRMESPVVRGHCGEDDCKGTVFCVEPHRNVHRLMCLSCGVDGGDAPPEMPRVLPITD